MKDSYFPSPWNGWHFRDGCLCSPTGDRYTPADFHAWHFERQLLAEILLRVLDQLGRFRLLIGEVVIRIDPLTELEPSCPIPSELALVVDVRPREASGVNIQERRILGDQVVIAAMMTVRFKLGALCWNRKVRIVCRPNRVGI